MTDMLRRLSIYFTNGEAVTYELEPEDVWDPIKLHLTRGNNVEWIQFFSATVAYWRLLRYPRPEKDPTPKPPKPPDPEMEFKG